jgi:hypothetical protein
MSYKKKAATNRDALFGAPAAAGPSKPSSKSSPSKASRSPAPSTAAAPPPSTTSAVPNNLGYSKTDESKSNAVKVRTGLQGDAKDAKMKVAKEYLAKAQKCMQKSIFSSPDPVAASTFYKRAADAYQQCGELRLERLYRVQSAGTQMMVGAWATAAAE